jgi:hypothetical protein
VPVTEYVLLAVGEKAAVLVVEAPELQAYELKPAVAVRVTLEPWQTKAFAGDAEIVIIGSAFMVKLTFFVMLHPAAFVMVITPF